MKSFITFFTLTACLFFIEGSYALSLTGHLSAYSNKIIVLRNAYHFEKSIVVDRKGDFVFNFSLKPGYYQMDSVILYLRNDMHLIITNEKGIIKYEGIGSKENSLLQKLRHVAADILPVKDGVLQDDVNFVEPEDFIGKTDQYRYNAIKMLNGVDHFFLKTQTDQIDMTIRYLLYNYEKVYGIDIQKQKEYQKIMESIQPGHMRENMSKVVSALHAMQVKTLSFADKSRIDSKIWDNFDLNNEDLFSFSKPYGSLLNIRVNKLIDAKRTNNITTPKKTNTLISLATIDEQISNVLIKQSLLYSLTLVTMKGDDELDSNYKNYLKFATDKYNIEKIRAVYENLSNYKDGSHCPVFDFADINDNRISLGSLKGSYVYIDIWATWCVPCIAEIPSLKSIQKKYAAENIKFISLSIDKREDLAKWKHFVSTNYLGGHQVIAENAWNSNFIKTLNVQSIPRFILLDPTGKLISVNALRPSDPNLLKQLDNLLLVKN